MSGGGKRHKRGGHEEEHENHERWLVSYSDMMTLLMVLFIVLFAMGQVDEDKYEALKRGLATGFGTASVLPGSTAVLKEGSEGASELDLAIGSGPADAPTEAEKELIRRALAAEDRAKAQERMLAAEAEADNLQEAQQKITAALEKQGLAGTVRFTINERGLVVTVVTSSVVFAGDRAELRPAGQRIVDAIGPALRTLPNRIEVDGHTNQLPVPTRYYPTEWELSTARASAVVRRLKERSGIPTSRMSAAGYAGERPLYDPKDPRAVTMNRRVDIVVLADLPDDTRALLTAAAKTP